MKERTAYRLRLTKLLTEIKNLPFDSLLRAHLARYLCILMSGYLEVSVREIFGEYARNCSNQNVNKFVSANLARLQNPNMEKILQLCKSFDDEWHTHISSLTQGEIKDAVDSIVNTRNQVAHGRDTSITLANLLRYLEQIDILIDRLNRLCQQREGKAS